MKSRIAVAAMVVGSALSALTAASAAAQDGVKIQIGGGVAIPVARFDTTYTSGPAGLVAITNGGSDSPLGFRLDYSYNGFTGKTIAGKRYRDAHMNVVTGDIVFSVHTGPYIKPYILGGAGWYPYREATDAKGKNDWGANVGAGLTFPLPLGAGSGFLEGRLHRVFGGGVQARRFVPIILGVTL